MSYKDADKRREKTREWYHKNKKRMRAYQREYRKLNPTKERHWGLRSRYGISLEEYNALLASQNGCCLICEMHITELNRGLFVDHDHFSNSIRGLLCDKCNRGLGYYRDNPSLLRKAAEYLEKYR